jgi:polyhydroxybutyrate depolymerase
MGDSRQDDHTRQTLDEDTELRTIEIRGHQRRYRVHIGKSAQASPMPVVLVLHGRYGTGAGMESLTGFSLLADRVGFMAVYPDGINRSWDGIRAVTGDAAAGGVDDVVFIDAVIDKLASDHPIDLRRIYLVGMSNGGSFVHRLACELPGRMAAIASVAGTIPKALATGYTAAQPTSVMHIHGTADTIVRYLGSSTKESDGLLSASATVGFWSTVGGCLGMPEHTIVEEGIRQERYVDCAGGTEVILYVVEGGGHTWPGGRQYLPEQVIGKTVRTLDATSEIWAFFERHARPHVPNASEVAGCVSP